MKNREYKFRVWLKDEKRMVKVGSMIKMNDESGWRIWPYNENPELLEK